MTVQILRRKLTVGQDYQMIESGILTDPYQVQTIVVKNHHAINPRLSPQQTIPPRAIPEGRENPAPCSHSPNR